MQQVTKLFYRRITPPSAAGGARPCVCRGRPPAEGVNALTAFIGGRRRGAARRRLGCLLPPAADMPWCTRWSAVGHFRTNAVQRARAAA